MKRIEHRRLQRHGADPVPGVAGEVRREELDGLERRGGAGPDLADHQLHCRRTRRQRESELARQLSAGVRTRTWWEPMAM